MITRPADFMDKRLLPNPVDLSSTARAQLLVPAKSVRYGTVGCGAAPI